MDIQTIIPAALAGNVDACNQVADYYYDEMKLYEEALTYYEIAAEKNDPYALYSLAYYYLYDAADKKTHMGVQYMRRAANLNHPKACRFMGFFYFWGEMGLPVDYKESFPYMKKGADLGDAIAQSHVGQCYQDGIWGAEEEDHVKARYYYEKALAQNEPHGQWRVGLNYKVGRCGYPKDLEKAAHYFRLSADNGSDKGQLDFAICCYNGQGVPKDPRRALQYMEKSAEQGNDDALYRCGMTYFFADTDIVAVTDANLAKGRKYLQLAAEKGNTNAKEQLQEIAEMERIHGPITAAKIKGFSGKSSSSQSSSKSSSSQSNPQKTGGTSKKGVVLGAVIAIIAVIAAILIIGSGGSGNSSHSNTGYVPPSSYEEKLDPAAPDPVPMSNPYHDCYAVHGGSVLPASDTYYYEKSDLTYLNKQELIIARNEIYARHGYIFKDADLAEYFEACDWYNGTVSGSNFSDSVFNKYEKANIKTIVAYEKDAGYRS